MVISREGSPGISTKNRKIAIIVRMSKRFPQNIERDRTLDTLLLLDGEVFPMDNRLRYIMTKHLVHVGIIPRQNYKKRTIAIAKGEYIPKPDEPKIWFESLKTMAKVLNNKNQELLTIPSPTTPH